MGEGLIENKKHRFAIRECSRHGVVNNGGSLIRDQQLF